MEAAHTPGPWATDGQSLSWTLTAPDGRHLASILRNGADAPANARLIAAAPDLLAALEWAVETADTEQYEADWYAAARVAIAKARGEE